MIKFYEDNAGGIAAVVFDENGHVANVVCGCEQWTDTPDAVISAAQEGLPYCPDYDADEFEGIPVDCLAAELDARSELIAVITPDSVELYADDMGMAGRRLFGVEY